MREQTNEVVEIYTLSDENGVRYVGKANNHAKRLISHIRDCKTRNTPVYAWFRKCLNRDFTPIINVIQVVSKHDWPIAEREAIKRFLDDGVKLLNVSKGGDEPYCSREVRSDNVKKMNSKIEADPKMKRLRVLKQRIGRSIKGGFIDAPTAEKLRYLAKTHPKLFSAWANIQPSKQNA